MALHRGPSGWRLSVDGKPFFIKGVGGDGSRAQLAAMGANSFRTWGADNLDAELAEAKKHGLKVTVGIWLGHPEHGFKYTDQGQVARQLEDVKKVIRKYKDDPSVLMWALGNEMEGDGTHPEIWKAIDDLAVAAKAIDPNHPTMTVIAELGAVKLASIDKFCPHIDVVGVNSYGGGPSVGDRIAKAGFSRPYVVTEFGPPGQWECAKTGWGAPIELSSTAKEKSYRETYVQSVLGHPAACLGSYAFLWGNKQEATATWFGLLLPDKSRLGPTDVMQELWSGKAPTVRCPAIASLKVHGGPLFDPGATVGCDLKLRSPGARVKWVLQAETTERGSGGSDEQVPKTYPEAIKSSNAHHASVKLPSRSGGFRVFAYVSDGQGRAATVNVPIYVRSAGKFTSPKPTLPLDISKGAYAPSGWMGSADRLKLDRAATDGGQACLKFDYSGSDGWFAVAWQSPEGDWGQRDGGFDLSDAGSLTFWARVASGSQRIGVGVGLIKDDQPFFDTTITKSDFDLTNEWKKYRLDLSAQDLRRIKTGFVLSAAASGNPFTILLRQITFVQK